MEHQFINKLAPLMCVVHVGTIDCEDEATLYFLHPVNEGTTSADSCTMLSSYVEC